MFERHKDPLDSMEIGRKKDSIIVKEISFTIQKGNFTIQKGNITIQNPIEICLFLKDFEKLNLPKDPYMLIHSIVLITEHEVEDKSFEMIAAMSSLIGSTKTVIPDGKIHMKTEKVEIYLSTYEGRTAFCNGEFFQLPYKDQLKPDYRHLLEDEEYRLRKEKESDNRLGEMRKMMLAEAQCKLDVTRMHSMAGISIAERRANQDLQREQARQMYEYNMADVKLLSSLL